MEIQYLEKHKFVNRVINESMQVFRQVHGDQPPSFDQENDPLPDKRQFYYLHVGNRLANLVTWCKQLGHSVLYISNFNATVTMRKAGINRYTHLLYHIENYIVRVESVYDRVLKLVNAIFHLCNDPSNCTHEVIISNLKVKRTNIPSALRPLKKLLRTYKFDRDSIVHHESYQDKNLRRLELFSMFDESNTTFDPKLAESLPCLRKEAASDVIKNKKKEFTEFNKKLVKLLSELLDKIEPHYDREKNRLDNLMSV